MNSCGGWKITKDALSYPACDLPENVASAFSKVTKELVGAKYEPLMYLATQVVNGENHMLLCRETLSDEGQTVKISTIIINAPASGDPQILTVNPLF